jgi:DNA-binding CsgD family transcriptional regulator
MTSNRAGASVMNDKQPLPELLHGWERRVEVHDVMRLDECAGRQAGQRGGGLQDGRALLKPSRFDWRDSIDSLGTERFGDALLHGLRQFANVNLCVAVDLEGPVATVLFSDASFERMCVPAIPALALQSGHMDASVVRLDAFALGSLWRPVSNACDGFLVQGHRDGKAYGLAFFRMTDEGPFTESEVERIRSASATWLSLLSKHKRLVRADRSEDPSQALLADDVPRLEVKLQQYMPTLSRSEMRVCARILWGMSTPGIAVDLNLQPGSVATCRKRAYRRLGIGTRLELIRLFMSACMAGAQ